MPWGHQFLLLDKLSDRRQRVWYGGRAAEHGLVAQGPRGADRERSVRPPWCGADYLRRSLALPDSKVGGDALRDPYTFEFLSRFADAKELDLEAALLKNSRAS